MPQTTIVLPVYNGLRRSKDYLPQAIDSVLSQTIDDFELIVVDDGSTEDYSVLIANYNNDVRIRWIRKENGGQSSARNYGAKIGTGKYLAFIDQDDRWLPCRLERTLAEMFVEDPYGLSNILVYGDLDLIDAEGRKTHRECLQTMGLGIHPKLHIEDVLRKDAFVLPGTILVDRNKFLLLGGFRETLSGYEDDDLALRYFQYGKLLFIKKSILEWRDYPESYSYTDRMDKSRGVYYEILKTQYKNNELTGEYFVRDYIAPRFYYHLSWSQKRAIQCDNKEQYNRATCSLFEMRCDLGGILRIRALIQGSIPWYIAVIAHKYPFIAQLLRRLLKHKGSSLD